jgi:transcriptional regulator with XRE-family HTH domain
MDRARARSVEFLHAFAGEVRKARLDAGLSQRVVGSAVGVSRTYVAEVERNCAPGITVAVAYRVAAAVGLDLAARLYPGPGPIHDLPQIRLLRRCRVRLGPAWLWNYESTLPIEGDQRAWDARIVHRRSRLECVLDAETRIRDGQALLRRQMLKRRDDPQPRHLLLVNATSWNRRALREAVELFADAYPISTRRALAALAQGDDPGGDALILL